MKRALFFIILFIQIYGNATAQSKLQVDCNTIFIGIDSLTYDALFSNKYIKDTLFICRQVSSQTNKDAYTGKYLIGESATIEFFRPKPTGKLGDKIGDVGIELKTRSINQLQELVKRANQTKLNIDTATITYQDVDTTITWYNTVSLATNHQNFGFSTLEYQPQYLKYLGFTDEEIALPITFAQFNTKLSGGKPYPRLFSSIKSISLSANSSQIKEIKHFFKLNDFRNRDRKSINNSFTVFYEQNNSPLPLKLNRIQITLLTKQPQRNIFISNALTILVDGEEATFLFK
jgi:hypothetical protein